jgi:hypothetical protein
MSSTYNTNVSVDGCDALVCVLLHELARDQLLHRQHYAILASDTNCGAAVLDSFCGVLDLKVAAIGGEDGVGEIVSGTYRRLEGGLACEVLWCLCEVAHHGAGLERCDVVVEKSVVAGYQRGVRLRRYGVRLNWACMDWWIGSCMFDAASLLYRSSRHLPSRHQMFCASGIRLPYIWDISRSPLSAM